MDISPTSLILVAVTNNPRDMEIARLLGWYRIPFKSAPKVIAVDYLAFYQPASFGEMGGQIRYIAAVRGQLRQAGVYGRVSARLWDGTFLPYGDGMVKAHWLGNAEGKASE